MFLVPWVKQAGSGRPSGSDASTSASNSPVPAVADRPDADSSENSASGGQFAADATVTPLVSRKALGLAAAPLHFVENQGQFPPNARFVAVTAGLRVAVTDRGVSFAAPQLDPDGVSRWRMFAIDFVDPAVPCVPEGEGKITGTYNFFLGDDPKTWRSAVPAYASVRFKEVAAGVDVVLVERDGALAYDLICDPGANAEAAEFTCHLADDLSVTPDGALALSTDLGPLQHAAPKAWLEDELGVTEPVACAFELRGEGRFGFRVEGRDPAQRLVIDPSLQWSTYFGGSDDEGVEAIEVEAGVVTIAGTTSTSSSATVPFPIWPATAPPNHQIVLRGGKDAFITRLDPSQPAASQLIFSTYLGGTIANSNDLTELKAMSVDDSGGVAVVGTTTSINFPVSASPLQSTHPSAPGLSGFLTHFAIGTSPTSVTLDYSTYFGGTTGDTYVYDLDLNSGTVASICGSTFDGLLVSSNAYDGDYDGPGGTYAVADAFVARIDWTLPGTSGLVYSTYLSEYPGAPKNTLDLAKAVRWSNSRLYVGGETGNAGFKLSAAPFDPIHALGEPFVVKLNPALSPLNQLEYATFLGGSGYDHLEDIDVLNGAIYACGATNSTDFPVTPWNPAAPFNQQEAPGFDRLHDGLNLHGWVVKLKPNFFPGTPANDLRYGTYIGGGSTDWCYAIRRLSSTSVVVVGNTDSDGTFGRVFPLGSTDPAATVDSTFGGGFDAFVTALAWGSFVYPPIEQPLIGTQLRYSTFHGGTGSDVANGVATDGMDAYVGGAVEGPGMDLAGNVFDSTSDQADGFAAHWAIPSAQQQQ